MSTDQRTLGGRLPLHNSEALAPAQRKLFDQLTTTAVPWAEGAGLRGRTEAGQLIGPFNPALLTPDISSAFFEIQSAEENHTSLSERTRQVVILTVGAVWQAPYELYAHRAVGRQTGLSEQAVRILAQGAVPNELTDAEAVAHRVARALSVGHGVDDGLYRQAEAVFGTSGLMDIAVLAGIYHTVCAILTTFAIPAPS